MVDESAGHYPPGHPALPLHFRERQQDERKPKQSDIPVVGSGEGGVENRDGSQIRRPKKANRQQTPARRPE